MLSAASLLSLLLAVPADDAGILHALNRLTWGPRPGDVARVRAVGLDRWVEEQLHPDRIEDLAVEARLASLGTAGLSTAELRRSYEVPKDAKREMKQKQAAMGDSPSEEQLRAVKREMYLKLLPRMAGRPQEVIDELQEAKLLRAVYSERQLADVLTDFWMNHFNVYAAKGPDRYLLAEYESQAIRPHALGRFEDLLLATAQSPAMLFYLDNWISAAPGTDLSVLRRGMKKRPDPELPRSLGLNENYAREIMELHTLGVDGGYTQKDVSEVARSFTGWTVRGLRTDGATPEFVFVPFMHARGDKQVLGRTVASGGKDEGERVIRLLATHPSTARFISTKIARRFVSDQPPPALVDRMAATFRETRGEIREVMRTLLRSPEFVAADARGAKTKTPLEFAVSALRATGADLLSAREVAERLDHMGMPLYMTQPPTGYKDTAEAWVSSAGLLARLNFAADLAAGRLMGTLVDPASLGPEAGLKLGSPEFQRR